MVIGAVPQSPAVVVLSRLEAAGVRFRLDGEHLRLSPPDRVTADDLAALRAHKDDVTTILQCRDAGVVARRLVFEAAWARFPPGVLVYEVGIPWGVGLCFSCGDAVVGNPRVVRCWRCLLAVRLALGVAFVPTGVM